MPTSQGWNTLAGIQGLSALVSTNDLNISYLKPLSQPDVLLTQCVLPIPLPVTLSTGNAPHCSQQSQHHPDLKSLLKTTLNL